MNHEERDDTKIVKTRWARFFVSIVAFVPFVK